MSEAPSLRDSARISVCVPFRKKPHRAKARSPSLAPLTIVEAKGVTGRAKQFHGSLDERGRIYGERTIELSSLAHKPSASLA
jgi:hypothetical protein